MPDASDVPGMYLKEKVRTLKRSPKTPKEDMEFLGDCEFILAVGEPLSDKMIEYINVLWRKVTE